MASIPPSDSLPPLHIARAYQLQRASSQAMRPAMRVMPMAASEAVSPPAVPLPSLGLNRLIAGIVPGRIDFGGDQPAQVQGSLAMYRHPADRNTAATAVHAGRLLDTTA